MSDMSQIRARHADEFDGCEGPLVMGRCKCGHSRVYACGKHPDALYIASEPGCTCEWVIED